MRDTIDNVRDVTDHAMKMAFFVEYQGKQQISQSKRRRGAELAILDRAVWLIRILGEIRHYSRKSTNLFVIVGHYSRVTPEIKYTLFQRERAIFISCSRVREPKNIPC